LTKLTVSFGPSIAGCERARFGALIQGVQTYPCQRRASIFPTLVAMLHITCPRRER